MITVHIEPDGETLEYRSLNTVLQLLNKLGLRRMEALIIRDGKLLTPDLRIEDGDVITVRTVISRG